MTIFKLATTSPLSSTCRMLVVGGKATSGLTMKTSSRPAANKTSTTSDVPGITRVNGRGATQCLTKPGGTSSSVIDAGGIGYAIGVTPGDWTSLAILGVDPGE